MENLDILLIGIGIGIVVGIIYAQLQTWLMGDYYQRRIEQLTKVSKELFKESMRD